jgi:UDP-N-acetylglucosamine:LPS N-acetylglucosamine transferase
VRLRSPFRRSRRPENDRARPCRVALVGSSGGHLTHLLALRDFWGEIDRFWVTFDTPDAVSRLEGERTYWCHHPTNRNIPNLIRNTLLTVRILWRERPDAIVSSGAAVAVPFFWLGRLFFGARCVYIEVIDRIDTPTLTGRLVRPVASGVLLQWPEQRRAFPKGTLVGPIL